MTVQELVDFLRNYCGECKVHMLQCADDNPLTDDIGIRDAVGMECCNGDTYIVLIPE